jgi:hypothetical protein
MQRVLSFERLLRSVEGVVNPGSVLVAGEPLKEFVKGSKWPCELLFEFMSAEAWAHR